MKVEVLDLLDGELDLFTLQDNAVNPHISKDVLAKLAQHPQRSIRWNVASNTNTSLETLELLTNDEDYNVLWLLLFNPNLTEELSLKTRARFHFFNKFLNTPVMKISFTPSDNFQDNLKTVAELSKTEYSSGFFQTPFFRRWFTSQDLTELVTFYLATNYIGNVSFLTSIWNDIPYDAFQNYQDILTKFELYSTIAESEGVISWIAENMNSSTFLHMISHFYEKNSFQRTVEIYNDTISQLSKLINRKANITRPKRWRLEEFHDHMSHLYLESTVENKKHPNEFIPFPVKISNWKVYEPKDTLELAVWGRRVRNCVLSYEDKIFSHQSAIVLIEENDTPVYTAELDYQALKKGQMNFKQLVGLNNRSTDLDNEKREVVANLIQNAVKNGSH